MFIPPHCPNPQCPNRHHPQNHRWYQKTGRYHTKTFGSVPRFRCKHCSQGFSQQTFSINYFAKRNLNYSDISNKINAGAGIRAIARQLKVRPKAITNRINRLGRNATLLNQQIADTIGIGEDMVIDGLENFCPGQRDSHRGQGLSVRLRMRLRHPAAQGENDPGAEAKANPTRRVAFQGRTGCPQAVIPPSSGVN